MNHSKEEKLSLLTELIKLARVDKEIKEMEHQFLLAIANQLQISQEEFETLFKNNDVGNLTISTGDFNYYNLDSFDRSSKAYTDFINRFHPVDTFRLMNPSISGFTYDKTINNYASKQDPPSRFDYIFAFPENRASNGNLAKYKVEVLESKIMFNQPVNGKFLSDHFGLTTTFRFHFLP